MVFRGSCAVNHASHRQLRLLTVAVQTCLQGIQIADIDRRDFDMGAHAFQGAHGVDAMPLPGGHRLILPVLAGRQAAPSQQQQVACSATDQPAGRFQAKATEAPRNHIDPPCGNDRGCAGIQ